MPNWQLTRGAVEAIMKGNTCEKPLLQVLGLKKITGAQGPERYRLLLSDGECTHSSAMLATQLNEKVTSGQLDANSVILLDKYICNSIQPDKRVMILLEVTVLASGDDVGSKIGNPQPLRTPLSNASSSMSNHQPLASSTSSLNSINQPEPMSSNRPASFNSDAVNHNSTMDTIPATNNNNNNSASSSSSSSFRNSTTQNTKGFYATTQQQQQSHPSTNRGFGGDERGGWNGAGAGGGGGGGGTGGETPNKVNPIASLTPYQNRWTIRARVTQKSDVRNWSNSRGEGKLFNMTFLDESGEIKATAFKSEVDKFFDHIQVNKVYYIRKCILKTANKQYSSTNNDYEMTFTSETEVIPCDDAADDLPSVTFNFVPINQLDQHQPNSTLDVIGVVKEVEDVKTVISKQQKELKKREISLVDQSKVQVKLTLWGNDAEKFNDSSNPVLAVKACRLSDWGGRSLSAMNSSQLILNPDIAECHRLRGWFDSVGTSSDFVEYKRDGGTGGAGPSGNTNWKTFGDVKAQNLGQDKAEYFTAKATMVFIKKENCMYQACPQQDCNKKVIDQANGSYRCEKCQKEFPNFKWRMILSANLADFTDNHWITCFQETAETILGKKSDEIGDLKENDVTRFDMMFAEVNFKSLIFRLRSKMETFNDETRLKTVCVQASPINYQEYNQKLISDIEALIGPV